MTWLWYGHYVAARCLEVMGRPPDWHAIAEELRQAAAPPAEVVVAPDRKGKAAELAVRSAVAIFRLQRANRGPLSNPFSPAKDAELCYTILCPPIGPDKLGQRRSRNCSSAGRALQGIAGSGNGPVLTADLVKLDDNELDQHAAAILFGYLRTHVKGETTHRSWRGQSTLARVFAVF